MFGPGSLKAAERAEKFALHATRGVLFGLGGAGLFAGGIYAGAVTQDPHTGSDAGVRAAKFGTFLLGLGAIAVGIKGGRALLSRTVPNGVAAKVSSGIAREVGGLAKNVWQDVKTLEAQVARPLLTGHGAKTAAVDAYFPLFNKIADKNDIRRFALNPRIMRRAIAANALIQVASIPAHGLYSPTPPPSGYYDGTSTRHVGDMGVDSNFAGRMMGHHNSLYQ